MMSFIRPEASAVLTRWREVLVGLAVLLLGLWWLFFVGGLLGYLGPFVALAGSALIWIGVQRGRFRRAGDGQGSVQIDEGQIMYFGPHAGGAAALRELERLTLNGAAKPPHWRLEQKGQPALLIPLNAVGADLLFDAFASLPGLKTARMLSELESSPAQAVVIWERQPMRPAGTALH
ncbi:MAG: hypothetical protein ABJ251_02830 [Paracoccaceae bacterium]